jgi:trigger factor
MKHTVKKLSESKVELTISVDAKELGEAKAFAVKELSKTMKVAGFRPGKVPAAIAEKNLDPAGLANETVEYAINRAVSQVVDKEDMRILDRPKVDLKDFKPYESLEFTAEVEVLPEVKLGDYKKLTAKKDAVTVKEADIKEVIDRMLQGYAEKKEVERAAKDGDEVVIDFDGRDEKDAPVNGAKGEQYPLTLGSKTFIPGFEEGLVGRKVGDEFDLPVTFPDDYHAEALKGAEVTFRIKVVKVQEIVLPTLDDELAKKAGGFATIDELKADIKKEITSRKTQQAEDKYKDDLLGALVEKSEVSAPELLVHDQMHSLEQDATQNLMYQGISPDQYMESQGYKDAHDWHEKEFRDAAVRRVKAGLVLAELSKAEKIDITQEELETRLDEMKKQYANNPDVIKQLDSPDSRRDLANRVITEKTIARLVELNSKK